MYWTPRPVASERPTKPPFSGGLPVTQASALISVGNTLRYSSAIHDISWAPVPTSGAGTF